MKTRLRTSIMLVAFIFLFGFATAVHAEQVTPPYDLSGTWVLRAVSVDRSFCDGSFSREMADIEISIIQSGDEISMAFSDETDDQIFVGRTSNYLIGAESNDSWQVTVLTGKIAQNASRIVGSIVFFDKHECPDAETGWARYVMNKIDVNQ